MWDKIYKKDTVKFIRQWMSQGATDHSQMNILFFNIKQGLRREKEDAAFYLSSLELVLWANLG